LIPLKANYWSDIMNYDVHIVTTEQEDNQPFYPLSTKVIFHDLGINYDRTKSYFDKVNFSKVIENLWLLRKLLKSLNPHLVIIANQIPATLFFPLIGTKAKILREYHNTKFFQTKEKPTLLGRFKKYIDSKVDFQVVLSEEEKSFYDSDRSYHIP